MDPLRVREGLESMLTVCNQFTLQYPIFGAVTLRWEDDYDVIQLVVQAYVRAEYVDAMLWAKDFLLERVDGVEPTTT